METTQKQKPDMKYLVYTVNLDKRNEKGVPCVLEATRNMSDGRVQLGPNGVLKIYVSIIENGAETDLFGLVLANPDVGLENVDLDDHMDWETGYRKKHLVEVNTFGGKTK